MTKRTPHKGGVRYLKALDKLFSKDITPATAAHDTAQRIHAAISLTDAIMRSRSGLMSPAEQDAYADAILNLQIAKHCVEVSPWKP